MTIAGLNLIPALPETFLLCAVSVLLLADLFIKENSKVLLLGGSLLAVLVAVGIVLNVSSDNIIYTFHHMYVQDPLSTLMKVVSGITVFFILVYSHGYVSDKALFKSEYYALMLFALMGIFVMVSANNFLAMYVGLELLSLCSYALVALDRDSVKSTEAGMKYFVLGALASGMLLYGMSLVYGGTKTLDVNAIASALSGNEANTTLVKVGLVFLVAGLAFKLGAVPFHMWVPDVYHGAPTSVTVFISSAPKIASFVFMSRILGQALPSLHGEWSQMLMVLGVLSVAIGNITAVAQTNLKRMLAYSAISHMGFVILGVMVNSTQGYSASAFYILTYMVMTLGGFGLVLLLSRSGYEAEELSDLKGLAQRSPLFAGVLLVVMFSMAGIPSTVGFFGKFSVLTSVLASGNATLAIIVVLLSVIGAYYYLRVVKLAFFDEASTDAAIVSTPCTKVTLVLIAVAIVALGVLPQRLLDICSNAVLASFGG